MPEQPDPNAFTIERREVRNGVSLAYVHEGVGGVPIVTVAVYESAEP